MSALHLHFLLRFRHCLGSRGSPIRLMGIHSSGVRISNGYFTSLRRVPFTKGGPTCLRLLGSVRGTRTHILGCPSSVSLHRRLRSGGRGLRLVRRDLLRATGHVARVSAGVTSTHFTRTARLFRRKSVRNTGTVLGLGRVAIRLRTGIGHFSATHRIIRRVHEAVRIRVSRYLLGVSVLVDRVGRK